MSEPVLPAVAGPFELIRQIATGASSTVFEARNTTTGQTVALKVFHPQLLNDSAFSERLKREAETLKLVNHPNVVRLIQPWNPSSAQFFLELELVRGKTLKAWREEDQGTWIEPKLWILAQVARALGAVHEQHILHRDLKPDNILLSQNGTVKLADFGLARSELFRQQLTQTGSLVGSLAYMAPETIEGQRASYASDIFSFGIIAYELLCNRHPFHDESGQLQLPSLLAVKFTPTAIANARVPSEIASLIDACLRVKEADRPSSIFLLEAALMDYLQRQGLLHLAKGWVAGDESVLAAALKQKNQKLKSDIEKAMAAQDRPLLLARVSELHANFPHDQSLPILMTALAQPVVKEKKPWSRYATIALLLLCAGYVLWSFVKPASTPIPAIAASAGPAVAPAVTTAPASEPVKRVSREPVLPKPRPTKDTGTLRILADSDVRVYLNGREIPQRQLENYEVSPGHHALKMVKQGYDPIEQRIQVRKGRTTVINARAGGGE